LIGGSTALAGLFVYSPYVTQPPPLTIDQATAMAKLSSKQRTRLCRELKKKKDPKKYRAEEAAAKRRW